MWFCPRGFYGRVPSLLENTAETRGETRTTQTDGDRGAAGRVRRITLVEVVTRIVIRIYRRAQRAPLDYGLDH